MKISIITPNFNGARFLEQTVRSVLAQRQDGLNLEYIVVDGGSTDGSLDILKSFGTQIDRIISEPDQGPASAINKGFSIAGGDIIGWLNSDDIYHQGTLWRVRDCMQSHPSPAICFGKCRIVDEGGTEIRRPITRFKEIFFPISCRFAIQSINYISQPAMFFRREAMCAAGRLREDMKAAWDYEYTLRLWPHGGAVCLKGAPLSDFRWHENSISGSHFAQQFAEEYQAAIEDAGRWSPQGLLHAVVQCGIVVSYRLMASARRHARQD